MLPTDTVVELDDELDGISERDLLLARLAECAMFRHASERLRRMLEVAALSRPRRLGATRGALAAAGSFDPGLGVALRGAGCLPAGRGARSPPPGSTLAHDHADLGDGGRCRVAELVEELARTERVTFRRLTSGIDDRIGLVVRFLALLELVKQGLADVEQANHVR